MNTSRQPAAQPSTFAGTMSNTDRIRTVTTTSVVSTVIEWYDFFICGTVAVAVFGPSVQPRDGPTARVCERRAATCAIKHQAILAALDAGYADPTAQLITEHVNLVPRRQSAPSLPKPTRLPPQHGGRASNIVWPRPAGAFLDNAHLGKERTTLSTDSTPTLSDAITAIVNRAAATHAAGTEGFPHFADMHTGEWTRSQNGDWTGGFFVGQLWLAAAAGALHDAQFAQEWTERVLPRAKSDTIFRGFLFWYGAALGQQLLGDERAGKVALEGALALADSFHPAAGLLPLGTAGEEAHSVGPNETNIDGVPGGAPLLYWAAEVTGDESLREKARSHVTRHVNFLVRPDGSVVQSATFDAETGNLVRTYTHKGVTDDSTWARAQAWAMLGLAQAAQRDPQLFAAKAIRVCDWWCDHLPLGDVSYWDFDAPSHEEKPLLDTSATAIAAASLLKMRGIPAARADEYDATARRMVAALVTRHLSPGGNPDRPAGILGDACYNRRIGLATSHELVWGTYFLLESLLALTGQVDTTRI